MSKIKLYHGTTADFSVVSLMYARDKKDFGMGFYTTTDINQACKLAVNMRNKAYRKGNMNAKAYVYSFAVDRAYLDKLYTHTFQGASISWVDYII